MNLQTYQGYTPQQDSYLQANFGADWRDDPQNAGAAAETQFYQQDTVNAMPTNSNNPWYGVSNSSQLAKNSAYLPPNYFVSGPSQIAVNANDPSTWNPATNPATVNTTPQAKSQSGYPAMPNSFGLGAQGQSSSQPQFPMAMGSPISAVQPTSSQPIQGNTSDPNYAVKALSSAVSDSGSRGFNPWSMQGEANARK